MDTITPRPETPDQREETVEKKQEANPSASQPLEVSKKRPMPRIAFALAIAAQLAFFAAALVPTRLSYVCGAVSGCLAVVAFILGLVSLRRRPRNLAVAALVFSGVLILIGVIILVGFTLVKDMVNAPTA